MHERERHGIILSAVQERPVVTVVELCSLTGASEATIRRDIAALHVAKKLRRVRGGAEALAPNPFPGLAGRPFAMNETRNIAQKQAIARAAVDMIEDGEPIIINGGTTTFPDGTPARDTPLSGVHQLVSDCRASFEDLEKLGADFRRCNLPRTEHRAIAFRQ